MQKRMFILPMLLASTQVMADGPTYPDHYYGLYMRSDLEINSSDGDFNNEGDSTRIKSKYLRVNFRGNLSEDTSYRVRFRLDKTLDSSTQIDGTGVGVNYAYIDHKLTPSMKLRFGKQYFAGVCGREGDYSGADVYKYSLTCDNNPFYREGIALKPKFGDQNFVFSLVNSGTEKNQKSLGMGATWYGNLMDGQVKPIVSYVSMPSEDQVGGLQGATNTFIAAGARYTEKGSYYVELTAMSANFESRTGGADRDLNSTVLDFRMYADGGKIQPIAKYEMSTDKDVLDRTALTLGVEYYPNHGKKGVDWRAHAVYVTSTDNFDAPGVDDVTTSAILLGYSLAFTGS